MLRMFAGFLSAKKGNVAFVFGLMVVPFLVLAGLAIDFGRAILVRERLGHALDAAILAVGASPELSNEDAQVYGEEFFHANFDRTRMGASYDVSVTVTDDIIQMSARANVPTTLLALLNQENIGLYQEAEAVRGGNHLELVMVLDNTGSMAGSKIAALRTAAATATEIIFNAGGSEPDAVKIGLVPFAATVNVGTDFTSATAPWLDWDAQSPSHHHQHTWNADINRFDLFEELGVDWAGCVESRAEPYDMEDAAPSAGNPATLFVPYFAADVPGSRNNNWDNDYADADSWLSDGQWTRAINGSNASLVSALWGGLSTTLRNLLGDGLNPSLNLGLGDFYNSEEGARQGYVGKYYESTNVYGDGPNRGCIDQAIFPLTTDEEAILDEIDAMVAEGNTNIPNGISWGIRVLSPTAPYTDGVAYGTDDMVKAMIVLTDGENVMSGANNPNRSTYNTYGFIAEGRFGTNSNNSNTLGNRLDDKTEDVCDYAKHSDRGIRIYTITFQVDDDDTQEMMEECASTREDGTALYWNSPSTADLEEAFQAIARDLVDLRLSR